MDSTQTPNPGLPSGPPPGAWGPPPRQSSNWPVVLLAGILMLVLGGGGMWFFLQRGGSDVPAAAPEAAAPAVAPTQAAPAAAATPTGYQGQLVMDPLRRISMAAPPTGWQFESDHGANGSSGFELLRLAPDLAVGKQAGSSGQAYVVAGQYWPTKSGGALDFAAIWDGLKPTDCTTLENPEPYSHPRHGAGQVRRSSGCGAAGIERLEYVFPQAAGTAVYHIAEVSSDADRAYSATVLDTLEVKPPPPFPAAVTDCSPDTGSNALPFVLVNQTAAPALVYWVGYDCALELYGIVEAGETLDDWTAFVQHRWVATSFDGATLATHVIPAGGGTWTIGP